MSFGTGARDADAKGPAKNAIGKSSAESDSVMGEQTDKESSEAVRQ